MKRPAISMIVLAMMLLAAAAARAHVMSILPYDELFDRSDLVVIAKPVTKTADTKEKTHFEDVVYRHPDGTQSPVPAIGVETVFEVLKVVKVDASLKRFVMHHYRDASSSAEPEFGGAMTVSFDPAGRYGHRDVLLFLVREKDGRFAPMAGRPIPTNVRSSLL